MQIEKDNQAHNRTFLALKPFSVCVVRSSELDSGPCRQHKAAFVMWVQKGSVKALHCSLLSWPKMCRNLPSSLSSTICVCAGLLLPPSLLFSLSFSPILSCHSIRPSSLSFSLSSEPRQRAPLTGWGMDSFHLMWFGLKQSHSPWARGSPLQSCVFIQANQHGRTGSPSSPTAALPLSLPLTLSIYFFHSLYLPLTLKPNPPFRSLPLPFCHPLLFFFTLYICLRLSVSFWSQGT